ncbi:hypothetical protein FUSO5_05060 [Fusobacterium necrophorum BFTR-1]|uniref:RES domain-containing protein n=1 Tax=Fusobacterium necrophorum TaxID=859 RepID=UPI0004612F50|nr:RES domain-containing protein [Fusobacterium necrophorum]KDE65230.1 hypothetical protein FUSO5_05060 [Fusobacterium necrophorum BFTR-1]
MPAIVQVAEKINSLSQDELKRIIENIEKGDPQVFDEITQIIQKSSYRIVEKTLKIGDKFFRIRELNNINLKELSSINNCWAPPNPKQGRYNRNDCPILYVAKDEETCKKEIGITDDNTYMLIKYELKEEIQVYNQKICQDLRQLFSGETYRNSYTPLLADPKKAKLLEQIIDECLNHKDYNFSNFIINFLFPCTNRILGWEYVSRKNPLGVNLAFKNEEIQEFVLITDVKIIKKGKIYYNGFIDRDNIKYKKNLKYYVSYIKSILKPFKNIRHIRLPLLFLKWINQAPIKPK